MWSDVLPLAIAMMAGPQIISALAFITNSEPVKVSLAYIAGITLASTAGIFLAFMLFRTLPGVNFASSGTSTFAKAIEVALVALLVLLAVRTYLNRQGSKPPKWLGSLSEARPGRAFLLGMALIFLMPSDLVIMLTAGVHLARSQTNAASIAPLVILVALIASLPLLAYLLFRKQITESLPAINNWINNNGWLINIAVYILFVFIIL